MKCEECQTAIEDYIDEAVTVRTAREVQAHLSSCALCARSHEEFKREQAIYASYQRDVDVTPALWESIESRIRTEPAIKPRTLFETLRERFAGAFATPRFSPAFAAALVLLAVGITAVLMSLMSSRGVPSEVAQNREGVVQPAPQDSASTNVKGDENPDGPAQDGATNPSPAPTTVKSYAPARRPVPNARPTPEQLVREAENKYLQAIAILSRDVKGRRSQIDPTTLARFDAALSDIDRTIAETKQASRQNPGDPIALQYLLAAYSKKVDALREMSRD
ncbi:MAG TPA: zf-HC2 domain-containing protein [Blastocatellia bacterium]|nr:zf-HC2 domain-containing protein [Blastocatellia bacterium]